MANARAARAAAELAAVEHLRGILPGILQSEDAAEGVRSSLERRKAVSEAPDLPDMEGVAMSLYW